LAPPGPQPLGVCLSPRAQAGPQGRIPALRATRRMATPDTCVQDYRSPPLGIGDALELVRAARARRIGRGKHCQPRCANWRPAFPRRPLSPGLPPNSPSPLPVQTITSVSVAPRPDDGRARDGDRINTVARLYATP